MDALRDVARVMRYKWKYYLQPQEHLSATSFMNSFYGKLQYMNKYGLGCYTLECYIY